jgi:hypothetical protein
MGSSIVCAMALTLAGTVGAASAAGPPQVTGLNQHQGPEVGRLTVIVRGQNLSGATAVDFGGVPAPKFFFVNGGAEIGAVSPPGTGVVDVTVTTPEGTSAIVPADEFTYRATPEFGRCLHAPSGGKFRANGCQTEEASGEDPRAVFEWFPGFEGSQPLEQLGLTFVAAKGLKLETPAAMFACTSAGGAGSIAGPTTLSFASLALSGCTSKLGKAKAACHGASLGAGEIHTAPLEGQMGITELNPTQDNKDLAGVELSAAGSEPIAQFSCGGTPVTIRGAVILDMKKPNKMTQTLSWKATASKGVQKPPTSFLSQPAVGLEVEIGEGTLEPIALVLKATGATEEAVMFNTKV